MKKNWKLIIISVLIGMIISTVGIVTAQTIIQSKEVSYDNNKSKGSFNNVQDSLDELYQRAGYTGEEYHEDILNGAYPVLSGELIPVYIKGNGDVYYANTHTEWYSYKEKRWANAVILVDDAYAKNRKDNKDKYSVGDKIEEEDIESYFVWIPRYAYKLWDLATDYTSVIDVKTLTDDSYETGVTNILGAARVIDISFGTNSYLTGNDYKKLIRNADGTYSDPAGLKVDDWLVHPAFTLGGTELNGFWMGKFEVGYNQTNTGGSAITGTDKWTTGAALVTKGDSTKVVVKPNVFSWRNMTVFEMFNTARGYNTELKSHMLKNTEWGAVAYLSHSKYGKGAEININNTNDYKTGYSAINASEKTPTGENGPSTGDLNEAYNTPTGYLASTTGNITGVYDMAGGAWEYVAATMVSGRTNDGESGFTAETIAIEMKNGYIDGYPCDSTIQNYTKRILGDATGEIGPFYYYWDGDNARRYHSSWYADFSDFVHATYPWFDRGGGYTDGVLAGAFYFFRRTGEANGALGFRLALAPSTAGA